MHRHHPSSAPRRAVFIDQHGALLKNAPHNVDPALLQFRPAAPPALQALAKAGFALLLVTNQSGLAHGHGTRRQCGVLQRALQQRLRDEACVQLLDVLVCAPAPGVDGTPACVCGKPTSGLLVQAARRHKLDLAASWLVGASLDDVEAGRRAGCRTVLLDPGSGTPWQRSPLRTPHSRLQDWDDVAHRILADTLPCAAATAPGPMLQALRGA